MSSRIRGAPRRLRLNFRAAPGIMACIRAPHAARAGSYTAIDLDQLQSSRRRLWMAGSAACLMIPSALSERPACRGAIRRGLCGEHHWHARRQQHRAGDDNPDGCRSRNGLMRPHFAWASSANDRQAFSGVGFCCCKRRCSQPHAYGSCHSRLKNTTASGGTVITIECGCPCQGVGSEGTPPALPMSAPP